MFDNEYHELCAMEHDIKVKKHEYFTKVAKAFIAKYGKTEVFFPEEDAPSVEYIGMIDGDVNDSNVLKITLNGDNGEIKSLSLNLYYIGSTVEAEVSDILNIDYLYLGRFIESQLDEGIVEPDEID